MWSDCLTDADVPSVLYTSRPATNHHNQTTTNQRRRPGAATATMSTIATTTTTITKTTTNSHPRANQYHMALVASRICVSGHVSGTKS